MSLHYIQQGLGLVHSGVVVEWLTTLNTVQDDDMLCVSVLGAGKARAALPIPEKHNSTNASFAAASATSTTAVADSAVTKSSISDSTSDSNGADAGAAAGDASTAQAGKLYTQTLSI
jgi:hypothetical protein